MYNEVQPHELTDAEIIEVIDHFVAAVQRAKKAGFDGVQLHLAHGYLFSSFLSPHMNKRKDKWGGSIHNRFRIIHEILIRCRKSVGDYPIFAKINAFEKSSDGMKTSEAIKISMLLEKYGCNGIDVSSGIGEDGFWTTRGQFPFEIIKKDNFRVQDIPAFLHPIVKLYLKKRMESSFPYTLYNLEIAKQIKNAEKYLSLSS
ncbi:hypothetical protein Q5O14_09025 [Eubacteriaceae bacterium ES2]|nr:hypothetical protein Q5O14_09025 [Eubacteriaceae bacterium ES2]